MGDAGSQSGIKIRRSRLDLEDWSNVVLHALSVDIRASYEANGLGVTGELLSSFDGGLRKLTTLACQKAMLHNQMANDIFASVRRVGQNSFLTTYSQWRS